MSDDSPHVFSFLDLHIIFVTPGKMCLTSHKMTKLPHGQNVQMVRVPAYKLSCVRTKISSYFHIYEFLLSVFKRQKYLAIAETSSEL
jgi:hypothetical protein